MAIETTRAEVLCRALHDAGLLPDWHSLSAREQIALDDAARALDKEPSAELFALREEIESRDREQAERRFQFVVHADGTEEFYFGARELTGVESWSARFVFGDDIETKVRLVVRPGGSAVRGLLLSDMWKAGIEIVDASDPDASLDARDGKLLCELAASTLFMGEGAARIVWSNATKKERAVWIDAANVLRSNGFGSGR